MFSKATIHSKGRRMRRIILDVDDTLNSLTMPILRVCGCDVGDFDYHKFPHEVGYDIIRACEALGGDVPYLPDGSYDVPTFWDRVSDADLWRSAPKSPQCDTIIELAAEAVGRDNVYIATTPTKDPRSHADKLLWIWDHLPGWIHRQYFITPRKWLLGKEGTVLVDDHFENCEKFVEEGGTAILVPRPWNRYHWLDSDSFIQSLLRKVKHVAN